MDLASENEKQSSRIEEQLLRFVAEHAEIILFVILLGLAIVSRFYILDARVMSHDENTHVYYSWRFMRGEGLQHDPLMHGPFQFHLIALAYFMFGDNDFTARVPAALFSIATVAFMWAYRRYLGKAGALVAAALMVISPYILYYGRYSRNEAFVAFYGVVTLWAILRYLESGKARYLYYLTTVTVLHFASKETAFIYTAQALVFLAFYFLVRIVSKPWVHPENRRTFLIFLLVALLFMGAAGASMLLDREAAPAPDMAETASPQAPGQPVAVGATSAPSEIVIILLGISLVFFAAAAFFLFRGYTVNALRQDRAFSLLILLGTLVLPHLSAFPVRFMGWDIPTNAAEVTRMTMTDIWHIAVFLAPLSLLSLLIGLWWNPRLWLINATIFYSLFTLFFTSLFTNGAGFFTGVVGSLGYWVEQQGVNRGSQPWYYYALVQVPVYEYLPFLGTLLACVMGFAGWVRSLDGKSEQAMANPAGEPVQPMEAQSFEADEPVQASDVEEKAPVLPLLVYWSFSSLVAFSVAGEKMPWLTVHITLAMILCTAWALGKIIDAVDWSVFREKRGWLLLALVPIFLISASMALASLLGTQPPFQGQELNQLQATSTFLTSFLGACASGAALIYLARPWPVGQLGRVLLLSFFALMAFLTARTAVQSSYINYDNANELLVYAHSAPGVKIALSQIEEISRRTTDGLGIVVAYDNETSYPYWWYLRNFTNVRYYGNEPTRSLRDAPVILVGDANFGKIEPVVGQAYDRFDYIRLWWPNQDYYGLSLERIWNAIKDPAMREAVFQIWLNRDYTQFGQAVNRDMALPNWSPAARMRLYIRKDVVGQLWNYGAAPSAEAVVADPFEEKHLSLSAERVLGSQGAEPGQYQGPRDLEVAEDGSLYVADTGNHRIQHISPEGEVLHVWGAFGDLAAGAAPEGTFNQPWGVGIGRDGSVYVADTWNHRVQKFSADGKFLKMWGYFGQAENPDAFWGPRDIAVSDQGLVFITDTGNKRVVVFDEEGNFITQFGTAGMLPGEFDEPVGVTLDKDGRVFVADTWNQRVQVFERQEDGVFLPVRSWDVPGWYGQSLDNKPYLAVDELGRAFLADPEGYRVMVFSSAGQALLAWGDYGTGADAFGLAASAAIAPDGGIWVTDAGNHRIMYFLLPAQ
jgi:uncharacterized protein (TIGR03663 family)